MSIGVTMLPTRDYMKGMLVGSLAFLGLSFCSPPAPADTMKGTAFEQITCLADNIYWEARNQPVKGMFAVAFVVDNRVSDYRYPNTYCEVIKQGPTRPSWKDKTKFYPVKNRCQFSWYCDGKSDDIPKYDREVYKIALNIARNIFFGQYKDDITFGATHYHADYVYPAWRKSKTKTLIVGNHIFYRWENNERR